MLVIIGRIVYGLAGSNEAGVRASGGVGSESGSSGPGHGRLEGIEQQLVVIFEQRERKTVLGNGIIEIERKGARPGLVSGGCWS